MIENKLTWVDSLKGIAICGVVMIHSGAGELPNFFGAIGRNGNRGVQLFFLISAFLTWKSLEQYFSMQSKMNGMSILRWQIKKLFKLMPLYYLAMLIYTLVTGGSEYWLGCEGSISVKNVMVHLFFLHGLFPHYANSIFGVEWYLGALVIFYFLAPYMYKYINSLRKATKSFLASIVICIGIIGIGYLFMPQVEDTYIYKEYLGTISFFAQLPVLALGIMLYYILQEIYKEGSVYWIKNKKAVSYIIFSIAVVMIIGQVSGLYSFGRVLDNISWSVWFSGIIISQFLWKNRMVDNRVLRCLGRYSYPVYLVHCLVIRLYDFVVRNGADTIMDWIIKYMFILSFSFFISYILIRWFDSPIQRKLAKLNVIRK